MAIITTSAEHLARDYAARQLAEIRREHPRSTNGRELLWEAMNSAARIAAAFLEADVPAEAAVYARAYRLLNDSWQRLIERHKAERAARDAAWAAWLAAHPAAPHPGPFSGPDWDSMTGDNGEVR
ncbi:hypothetical protein GCM10028784_36530 [Myceligenerans cantabricum]